MATELHVTHETLTRYAARVDVACHVAHLEPRSAGRQEVEGFEIAIEPPPSQRSHAVDSFGNARLCFSLYAPHDALHVRSTFRAFIEPAAPVDPASSARWESVAAALTYRAGASYEAAAAFVYPSPFVPLLPALRTYAQASFPAGRALLAGAIDLMHRIHADFRYQSGATEISTPLTTVFEQKRGVCQDFAHVMIGCMRALKLPVRYVSGYLLTQPPPGKPRLIGADASHAWISAWDPGLGWIDLDPTNDVLVDTSHVTLATGRDYGDVMPLRGIIQGGGDHTLAVAVTVRPAHDPSGA